MNKLLYIVAGSVLLAISIGATVAIYIATQGSKLDTSSRLYVDESIPIIAAAWSKDELLKRSSPQLLEMINRDPKQSDQLFTKLSKLGQLEHYNGSRGQAIVFFDATGGKVITAQYVASAIFQNGQAQIQIRLVQSSGQWHYLLFNVTSPLFRQ